MHPNWKEEKLSLFTIDMTLYIENPNDSTKNLLEIMNKYSKVTGHRISNATLGTEKEINSSESETNLFIHGKPDVGQS